MKFDNFNCSMLFIAALSEAINEVTAVVFQHATLYAWKVTDCIKFLDWQ